jgi:ankyrin repeat protein
MAAAYTRQANAVRLLLEFGADTTARDICGKTAQELAQELAQDLTRGLLHQEVSLAFAEHGAA